VTVLAVTGGIVIVIGALVTALFLAVGHGSTQVARRGIEVAARVVGTVEHGGEPDPVYGGGGGGGGFAPVVSFCTVDGEVVAASSRHVYGSRRRVPAPGTAVRVRYDPGNPREIYIRGWDTPARFMLPGFVAGGVAIVLAGAYLLVSAFVAA
jgi:uncharacterized protein DUF3592